MATRAGRRAVRSAVYRHGRDALDLPYGTEAGIRLARRRRRACLLLRAAQLARDLMAGWTAGLGRPDPGAGSANPGTVVAAALVRAQRVRLDATSCSGSRAARDR